MGYATVAELRAHMQMDTNQYDTDLERLLDTVSEALNRQTNHPDGFVADAAATARIYQGSGDPYQPIDECVSITTVEVKDSQTDDTYDTWASGDCIPYRGSYRRPNYNRTPYTALMIDPTGDESLFTAGIRTVKVTAQWGYSVVCPPTIETAAIMLSARWYKRLQTGMSQSVGKQKSGKLTYNIETMDPDIWTLLVAGRFVRRANRFGGHSG